MSLSSISRALRDSVRKRDGGQCQYCGLHQFGQVASFHVDHIVPRSKGGPTAIENLALQCPWCSLHKSNAVAGSDPVAGDVVPLFHPLRDIWTEHFQVQEDGAIAGLTAAGRATVATLRMNDPLPKVARAIQMKLGMG